jgi:glutaminyl-tRNA synthetase
MMSKRYLLALVTRGVVSGWDDPRMPTISGMRRRGYPAEAIRNFATAVGVTKANGMNEYQQLEFNVREQLNLHAPRVMAVLRPLKVTIENYPEGQVEWFDAENNPEDPSAGTRKVPFSRVIYIEQDDYKEEAPKKWFRLAPGMEVRLKHAYYIKAKEAKKDAEGNVVELICTYDPESRGGGTSDGRVVKGTLQWVSAEHAINATVREYESLFTVPVPTGDDSELNPNSLTVLEGVKAEPSLKDAKPGDRFQFLRMGYFAMDPDSKGDHLVFNRTATLKDTWAKVEKKG